MIFALHAACLAVLAPSATAADRPPGVIIDYSPASSERYIGSPSLAVWTNGQYFASHDFFGPGTKYNETVVFTSADKGKSWRKLSNVTGQFWSTLFVHRDALYLIGTSEQNGFAIIRRSKDQGKTWTTPTTQATGLLLTNGNYHCAPVPVVIHEGRLWRAMEKVEGKWGKGFNAFMMSIPTGADLLIAPNWTVSNTVGWSPDYLGGKFGGWLEGNAIVTRDERIVDVLRVDYREGEEKAAIIQINKDGSKATFENPAGFVDFPGGCKKFTIRFDPKTSRYWSLSNWVPENPRNANPERTRNTLALISSATLREWTVHAVLLQHPDNQRHAFQYLDWQFEGNDIIALSRTAFDDDAGGAHNQHDANFLTFHRFPDFRKSMSTKLTR